MGRKKKPKTLKPFCYYCDRVFDDEGVLAQHQKAKHFKCNFCSKRLPTAHSLFTHIHGVHKEIIDRVPNAIPGRDTFDVSIYGMDGVPQEIIDQKMLQLEQEEQADEASGGAKRSKSSSESIDQVGDENPAKRHKPDLPPSSSSAPSAGVSNSVQIPPSAGSIASAPPLPFPPAATSLSAPPLPALHQASVAKLPPPPLLPTQMKLPGIGQPLPPPPLLPSKTLKLPGNAQLPPPPLPGMKVPLVSAAALPPLPTPRQSAGLPIPPIPTRITAQQVAAAAAAAALVVPLDSILIFSDEAESMEEKRARLPRHKLQA